MSIKKTRRELSIYTIIKYIFKNGAIITLFPYFIFINVHGTVWNKV